MMKKANPARLYRLLLFVISMLVLTGLLASCGSSNSSPEVDVSSSPESKKQPNTIRIGYQPPYVPVYVLKDQKLFQQTFGGEAPKIKFTRFLSLIPITEALSSGAIDLAIGGTPVAAVASDLPIRILALTERSPKTHAILVRPDSDIKSIDDLKGKRIATPTGDASFFPQKVLQNANIKSSEVNWVKIENDLGRSALLSGNIDAWVTWDPFYASAEISKEAVPLVDGEKYFTNHVVLMGNAQFVENYPEVIAQFIQAYRQALAWVRDHPEEAVQIFAEANQVGPEIAELTMKRRTYLLKSPDDEDFVKSAHEEGEFFAQIGVTQKEPDWDTVIVPEIAKSVLGQ